MMSIFTGAAVAIATPFNDDLSVNYTLLITATHTIGLKTTLMLL